MAKSIFISNTDTFDVVVNYKDDGKRLKVVPEEEKNEKGEITSKKITVSFKYPDFSTSQKILRSATTPDSNGAPSLNFLQLQTSLIYALASKWDVVGEDGKAVELNSENISKLRVEIAKELISEVYKELGDGGLI